MEVQLKRADDGTGRILFAVIGPLFFIPEMRLSSGSHARHGNGQQMVTSPLFLRDIMDVGTSFIYLQLGITLNKCQLSNPVRSQMIYFQIIKIPREKFRH